MVVYAWNSNTWEMEAGESGVKCPVLATLQIRMRSYETLSYSPLQTWRKVFSSGLRVDFWAFMTEATFWSRWQLMKSTDNRIRYCGMHSSKRAIYITAIISRPRDDWGWKGRESPQWNIYVRWVDCCTQTLTVAIPVWIRRAGPETCQNHRTDKGGAHEALSLFEDPLAIDCCWSWKSQHSLEMLALRGYPCFGR